MAGNLAMIHLLLAADPSGIRRVPSQPAALAFPPADAAALGWPGGASSPVFTAPAAGGWVGGDIVAGAVRAGFSRSGGMALYVDLGTNGEIVLGGAEFALACACSAGPAFEGGGIRCGMRADRGAVDGAAIDAETGALELSVIGGGRVRGRVRIGADRLGRRIIPRRMDRPRRPVDRPRACPSPRGGKMGTGNRALGGRESRPVGTRPGRPDSRQGGGLLRHPRAGGISRRRRPAIDRVIVSGNFGRFLNLPAAVGIGLLPDMPLGRYGYVDNGSLEGAALGLLSREFFAEIAELRQPSYLRGLSRPARIHGRIRRRQLPSPHQPRVAAPGSSPSLKEFPVRIGRVLLAPLRTSGACDVPAGYRCRPG